MVEERLCDLKDKLVESGEQEKRKETKRFETLEQNRKV